MNEEDDFDISALSSIIKNCKIFMGDELLQKHWNDCSVILKECRNELNHAAVQNSSPEKFQNFVKIKARFHICFQELSNGLDHDIDEMRYLKLY